MPKFDLHCHSNVSDGVMTPTELVKRAAEQGVELLAITDHDTTAGFAEASECAREHDIQLLPGVELTTVWNGIEIHIVGLGIEIGNSGLEAFNDAQLNRRFDRAVAMDAKLKKHKIAGVLERVQSASHGRFIGRLQFAKVMCDMGVVSSKEQAFKRWLGAGKPAFTKVEWPSIERAVAVIRDAGGVSVLAHPLRYKMTNTKLKKLCAEFKLVGGKGIEVSRCGERKEHQIFLAQLANSNELLASGGSDFHAPGNPWCELGKFPPLPEGCKSVLDELALDVAC